MLLVSLVGCWLVSWFDPVWFSSFLCFLCMTVMDGQVSVFSFLLRLLLSILKKSFVLLVFVVVCFGTIMAGCILGLYASSKFWSSVKQQLLKPHAVSKNK